MPGLPGVGVGSRKRLEHRALPAETQEGRQRRRPDEDLARRRAVARRARRMGRVGAPAHPAAQRGDARAGRVEDSGQRFKPCGDVGGRPAPAGKRGRLEQARRRPLPVQGERDRFDQAEAGLAVRLRAGSGGSRGCRRRRAPVPKRADEKQPAHQRLQGAHLTQVRAGSALHDGRKPVQQAGGQLPEGREGITGRGHGGQYGCGLNRVGQAGACPA